jgi:hypothetical protein
MKQPYSRHFLFSPKSAGEKVKILRFRAMVSSYIPFPYDRALYDFKSLQNIPADFGKNRKRSRFPHPMGAGEHSLINCVGLTG